MGFIVGIRYIAYCVEQIIIIDWYGNWEVMTGWANHVCVCVCVCVLRPMAMIHAVLQEFGLEVDGLEYGVGAHQWADVLSESGESRAAPKSSAHGVGFHPSSEGGT